MDLKSRIEQGERLAKEYWHMKRNPMLMTVCGLNPAKRRGQWRETGREVGGTMLKSAAGAAASLAVGPLIKKLGGFMNNPMMLLTAADRKRLPPIRSQEKLGMNAIAYVKFFTPDSSWTWYVTEFDGRDEFFGLVKGLETELGYFSLAELSSARGPMGLHIERDRYFRPTPLSHLPQSNPRRNPGLGHALLSGATAAVVGKMLRNPPVSMPPDLRQAVEAAARSGVYSAVPYAQLLLSDDTMYDDPMGTLLYLKSNLSYWRGPEAAAAKAVIAKYAKRPVRTWMSNPLNRSESGQILRHARSKSAFAQKTAKPYSQGLHRGMSLGMVDVVETYGDPASRRAAGRLADRMPKYTNNPCGSRFRANPHIVIDSNGLEVESIHRGHPTKTFNAAFASAQKHARTLGREFYIVAHPYVPPGWKHGSIVNPIFFAQGPYVGVKPDGRTIDYKTYSIPAAVSSRVIQKFAPRPIMPPRMNPGPSRKSTVPIAKFAGWVKSQRNPALMADFRKKVAAYKKWTHGSLPTKVSVEKINSPGLNGMIIATGLGKQPESTYIMPGGAKRGGAWKHKWETMPDMADAGNGLIVTKLRGRNRITNFMHG